MNKLWETLYEWNHNDGEFDYIWNGYSELSDITGLSIKELKKIIKKLREAKIMYSAPTVNSDYEISGSGNFLIWPYENKTFDELVSIFEVAIKAGNP